MLPGQALPYCAVPRGLNGYGICATEQGFSRSRVLEYLFGPQALNAGDEWSSFVAPEISFQQI